MRDGRVAFHFQTEKPIILYLSVEGYACEIPRLYAWLRGMLAFPEKRLVELHLSNIVRAEVTVSETGQRVLTAYTLLSTALDSPDREKFRILQAELMNLLDPRRGYDEIRIQSLHPNEINDRFIPLHGSGHTGL